MDIFELKEDCCGCTACQNVCPRNAIEMKRDEQGFLYPCVNNDKCINCNLCKKVCDFNKPIVNKGNGEVLCFAMKSQNKEEIDSSRSGAFFSVLAKYVISEGGFVIGCEMTDSKTIVHSIGHSNEDVNKFKGSKYVQSNMKNCFKLCADILESGKTVLFSGTGCQIHGLLSFLDIKKINKEKLITCDFICHGVPSPKIWEEYIDIFEEKKGIIVEKVNFRDKNKFGWRAHYESYSYKGSKIYSNLWARMFYKHIMFRPSCYKCKYTKVNRMSDFTIGDYWGIDKNAPELDDNNGVSLVLCQNHKSVDILEKVKDKFIVKSTSISSSLQPQLVRPVKKGKNYERFWREYYTNNYVCIKKYFFPNNTKLFFENLILKSKGIIRRI